MKRIWSYGKIIQQICLDNRLTLRGLFEILFNISLYYIFILIFNYYIAENNQVFKLTLISYTLIVIGLIMIYLYKKWSLYYRLLTLNNIIYISMTLQLILLVTVMIDGSDKYYFIGIVIIHFILNYFSNDYYYSLFYRRVIHDKNRSASVFYIFFLIIIFMNFAEKIEKDLPILIISIISFFIVLLYFEHLPFVTSHLKKLYFGYNNPTKVEKLYQKEYKKQVEKVKVKFDQTMTENDRFSLFKVYPYVIRKIMITYVVLTWGSLIILLLLSIWHDHDFIFIYFILMGPLMFILFLTEGDESEFGDYVLYLNGSYFIRYFEHFSTEQVWIEEIPSQKYNKRFGTYMLLENKKRKVTIENKSFNHSING